MKKRNVLIITLIVILSIGFASVATNLIINGTLNLGFNSNDFDVIFTEALINGKASSKATISENKKKITFEFDKFTMVGESALLDYKVKNNSTQYDAEVTINCTNEAKDYVEVTSKFDNQSLPLVNPVHMRAQEIKSGLIKAELVKPYPGEDTEVTIKCDVVVTAKSRTDYVHFLNFDSNGGSAVAAKAIEKNENYGELPIPEREDYVFLGWVNEAGEKITEDSIVNTNANETAYAKWARLCPYETGQIWNFGYKGYEEKFASPCDGEFQIEVWGAQGGAATSTYIGGYGGYAVGTINLAYETPLFINVGGMGGANTTPYSSAGAKGGYNGGGTVYPNSGVNHLYGAGGGATHVALESGLLSAFSNRRDKIVIVAGGGGGGRWQENYNEGAYGYGGHGGGYIGAYGSYKTNANGASGGTQTSGFGFGQGQNINVNAAGGGGFYGGFSNGGGGGGSGYIGNPLLTNKSMYCYKCATSNEESTKTISTTAVSSSAVSGYAKTGHGYARIKLVSLPY